MKSYFFVGMLVVFGLGLSACSGASIPVVPTLSETAESVSEGAAGADESVPESAATPAPAQEQNSPAQNSPEALIASFDQAAQTAASFWMQPARRFRTQSLKSGRPTATASTIIPTIRGRKGGRRRFNFSGWHPRMQLVRMRFARSSRVAMSRARAIFTSR